MTSDSDTVPSDFLGDVGQLCVIHQALISRKARPSVPVGEQVFHRLADIIFINIIMNTNGQVRGGIQPMGSFQHKIGHLIGKIPVIGVKMKVAFSSSKIPLSMSAL